MSYAAVIGGVATVAGSMISADAASGAAGDAAKAMEEAAAGNRQLASQQMGAANSAMLPYSRLGKASSERLMSGLGLGDASSIKLPNGMTVYDAARQKVNDFLGQYGAAAGAYTNIDEYQARQPAGAERDIQTRIQEVLKENNIDPEAYKQAEGYGSLTRKFGQEDLAKDPVYNSGLQFGLDQGTSAINNRALASGGYDSGATLKSLVRFANDYGSTKANDSYNRYTNDQNNEYNKLAGQQAVGLNATQSQINAGQTATGQQIDANSASGNARAAGIVGGANAWGGIGNSISNAYGQYQSGQLLKNLLKPATVGSTYSGATGSFIDPYTYNENYG